MKTEDVVSLIADDSWAMTFQSMAQYRSALILAVKSCARAQGAGEAVASYPKDAVDENERRYVETINSQAMQIERMGAEIAALTAPTIPQAAEVPGFVLTAPDGRQWRAESALMCAAAEQRERIPAKVALDRIFADVDEFELEERASIAKELERHAVAAGDCPPGSMVVTLYSIQRLLAAAPTPTASAPKAEGADDRIAFRSYLSECEEYAIVPDVAGAFNAGWQARGTAPPEQAAREPLTEERIGELARPGYNGFAQQAMYDFRAFARAIERAHNILPPTQENGSAGPASEGVI